MDLEVLERYIKKQLKTVMSKISYVTKFVTPTLFRLSMTLLSIAFIAKYSPVPSNSTKWTL